jgi:hypothetical protein
MTKEKKLPTLWKSREMIRTVTCNFHVLMDIIHTEKD